MDSMLPDSTVVALGSMLVTETLRPLFFCNDVSDPTSTSDVEHSVMLSSSWCQRVQTGVMRWLAGNTKHVSVHTRQEILLVLNPLSLASSLVPNPLSIRF